MRILRWIGAVTLVLMVVASVAGAAVRPDARARRVHKAAKTTDNSTHMDANNLDCVVTNHGSYAYDLLTGNAGLIYPKGGTNTAVFAAGPWIGAKVNGQVRIAVGEYSQEYVPGPMVGGTFQADDPRFKSYKVAKGHTTDADYINWPVQDGAPVDSLGQPAILGDVMIWNVYNDADPSAHSNNAGGTLPLGVEIQQSTFAFNRGGALGNIIFIKYKIFNKGGNTLDSTYFSAWADPDLGGASDDLDGCDTTLSVGFIYNATNSDQQYGSTPPCVGWDFFRGPIVPTVTPGVFDTLGMTSFNKYINGTDPKNSGETYNYMQGLHPDGTPVREFDLPAGNITKFAVSGDPVAGTGWLDSNPADRRLQLSTGPFTMAPGDSQEVTIAMIVGQGTDRLSSITDMKNKDAAAQIVFDLNFDIPSPPPNPSVFVQALDKGIRLVWGAEPVGTHSANPSLGQDFFFEGFRVWQMSSNNATAKPTVIATFDLADSVGPIYSDLFNPNKGAFERTLVIAGKNEGLKFALDIKGDAVRGGGLFNYKEYYYAVTSYSFDVLNTSKYFIGVNEIGTIAEVLESGRDVHVATPRGSNAVQTIEATQISGDKVGSRVVVEQLILNAIADSVYHVTFAPDQSWNLINVTSGDTLLSAQTNISGAFDYPIVNGFMPRVMPATQPARIYQMLGGTDSLNLFNGNGYDGNAALDSSGIYYLSNKINNSDITLFNYNDGTNHDYEIRILPDTTQFAWEYSGAASSPEATFKVPFEVWDMGACSYQDPSDDVKVTAVIRDDDGSGSWTWGDRLYFSEIPYASVAWGTPGNETGNYVPPPDDKTLGRFGFIKYKTSYAGGWPPPERIRIRGGRLCTQDVFAFRTLPVGAAPGNVVGNDIKKILAVPNPYYAHSQYELTQFDRVIKFTNIPASRKVTIRIFNLAGDLVRTITRVPSTADEMARSQITWNINGNNDLPVASGIYIYRVDVEGVGSKTDRLAVFVEKERLDNF